MKLYASLLLVAIFAVGLASAAAPKNLAAEAKSKVPAAAPAKAKEAEKVAKDADEKKVASSSGPQAYFTVCPQGEEWIFRNGFCYRYVNESEYWYEAELKCRGHGGHLVSLRNKAENTFVGKLTYCEEAWTGLYAVDMTKLRDSKNYARVSGSSGSFDGHDFASIEHPHMPLIVSSNLTWQNRVYHAKSNYVCEVSVGNVSKTCNCPTGWKSLGGNCYFMPRFSASYIEADYYCRGRDAHLVSIHDARELRAQSLLDLDSDECPVETWIGLVKLNPCLKDYSTGHNICYQWSDRSQKFDNFPNWMNGHPNTDRIGNCVFLKGQRIATTFCYNRHRFVCKKRSTGPATKC